MAVTYTYTGSGQLKIHGAAITSRSPIVVTGNDCENCFKCSNCLYGNLSKYLLVTFEGLEDEECYNCKCVNIQYCLRRVNCGWSCIISTLSWCFGGYANAPLSAIVEWDADEETYKCKIELWAGDGGITQPWLHAQWKADLGEKPDCKTLEEASFELTYSAPDPIPIGCKLDNVSISVEASDTECPDQPYPCKACDDCGNEYPEQVSVTISGLSSGIWYFCQQCEALNDTYILDWQGVWAADTACRWGYTFDEPICGCTGVVLELQYGSDPRPGHKVTAYVVLEPCGYWWSKQVDWPIVCNSMSITTDRHCVSFDCQVADDSFCLIEAV